MGPSQEELETTVQQENDDTAASQKDGGMTHATGVLRWMASNSSEGIGKEGEAGR